MTPYIACRIHCTCGEFYARLLAYPEFCPRCDGINFRVLSSCAGQTPEPVPFILPIVLEKPEFSFQRRKAVTG